MIYKKRIALFLILIFLFLLITPLVVFYSFGWRFDWKTKKIVEPGIFYFKVWPKSANLYLNGKLEKKTDYFFGSALIENLKPAKYNVEIKKEGFHSWQKNLEIKKRKVTEVKNIFLVPENPKFTLIANNIERFFISPDKKNIILKEETSEGWNLNLFQIENKIKKYLVSEKDIINREKSKEKKVELVDLKFSLDFKKILLELKLNEKTQYYLLEIEKTPPILTPLGSLKNPESFFLPPSISDINKENSIIDFTVFNKDVYYLEKQGFLFKDNERLNILPFEIKPEKKYKITVSNSNIALMEDNTLYLFDKENQSFIKIFQPVKSFEFSLDKKKLVFYNDHEIWVLFLEKNYDEPQKEKNEKVFINRFSEKVNNVFWYTNHYLIFNTEDKVKIAEIDDRDKINIVDLAEFKSPEILWALKRVYVFSENNLYASEELIP